MVVLRIKKVNFDLILSGTKKIEYRENSIYNKKLLFKDRGDGKKDGNSDIKAITFINGYQKNARSLIAEVKSIRLVKFSMDVREPDNNFEALKDQFAIEIILGKIN